MKLLISDDYHAPKEQWSEPGVYMALAFAPSQSLKQSIYIGSSKNVWNRIVNQHLPRLKNGVHSNPVLLKFYQKHGPNCFIWYLLEYCELTELAQRENFYLKWLEPFADEQKGFNISRDAVALNLGRTWSEVTRQKIEAYNNSGIAKHENQKKSAWIHNTVTGETVFIHGLQKFCNERGLNYNKFSEMINRKKISYKGWRLTIPPESIYIKSSSENYLPGFF
jgi:group I intron endonuclease